MLLKNEGNLLPLAKDGTVALIGEFAEKPRFQGGGSSHINSFRTTGAVEAAKAKGLQVTYAPGYSVEKDELTDERLAEAVSAAKAAKTAVVFAGLPDSYESEGYDRTHMRMPECQNRLIEAVAALGRPDSEIFMRKYFYGQKSREIAEELGMKTNTIDKIVSRGLVKLRKILKEEA